MVLAVNIIIGETSITVEGPFLRFNEAAAYCGYKPDRFRKVLRESGLRLPASGPKQNKYAKSILDAFMACPDVFSALPSRTPRRRTPTPVFIRK